MTEPQAAAPSARTEGDEPEDEGNVSLATEFVWFLRENKKWWLIPLVLAFLLLLVMLFLGTNPAIAPFIYPIL
jgi:hypothetical protein